MSEKNQKFFNNNSNIIINNITNKRINEENLENVENNSLYNNIKKLNESINSLKNQLTNYEIGKNKLILSSNKKDKDLKEIKQRLYKAKLEAEGLKQRINHKDKNNVRNLNSSKSYYKNNEYNLNLLIQLQKKITDLELQLKKKENKYLSFSFSTKNIFLSPLKNTKNISLFIPSSFNNTKNKNKSISDLFITGQDELSEMRNSNKKLMSCISDLKQELSMIEKDRTSIEKQVKNLIKERNNLIKILKNKNEEISIKLDQQNKLSKDLMEQLDKNKKVRVVYRKIKIKNQNLEINKRLLEDIIFKQEDKVKKLSKSYKKILNTVKDKNEEINKSKNYIFNLEENFKKLQKKFEIIKNDKSNIYKINELKLKLQKMKEHKKEKNNKIFKNDNNIRNNLNNINYIIESPRSNYDIKHNIFLNHAQSPSFLNSFNKNNKIVIKNYSYKNYNGMKRIFNDRIRNNLHNENKINRRGILLKHNKSSFDIMNKNIKYNLNENNSLTSSLSINKKIKIFNEEQKEKKKIEEFKYFMDKFIKDLEK